MATSKRKREWTRKWYRLHPVERIRESRFQVIRASIRNKAYVRDYLLRHPCADCGTTDIRVLEFDHVIGEKEHAISNLVHGGRSINYLVSEIKKCEVRCRNCHKIRHINSGEGQVASVMSCAICRNLLITKSPPTIAPEENLNWEHTVKCSGCGACYTISVKLIKGPSISIPVIEEIKNRPSA